MNTASTVSFVQLLDSMRRGDGGMIGYDANVERNCVEAFIEHVFDGDEGECDEGECDEANKANSREERWSKNTAVTAALFRLHKGIPFAVGSTDLGWGNHEWELIYHPSKEGEGQQSLGTLSKPDETKILLLSTPSPYGDLVNQVTTVNPDVRLGMEIPAAQLSLRKAAAATRSWFTAEDVNPPTPPMEAAVANYVAENLLLRPVTDISIVLHKLNVYSAGGHFKSHTDTPTHDPSKFLGTAVVCLPSEHKGGELVVRHGQSAEPFNFADSTYSGFLAMAAFYGDCEHEVRPVTSGHRVVLTYSILHDPEGQYRKQAVAKPSQPLREATPSALHPVRNDMCDVLESIYAAAQTHFSGKCFGVFLSHDYTASALSVANLKGTDRLLYDGLVARGVSVSLLPVVKIYRYTDVQSPPEDLRIGERDLAMTNFRVCRIGALEDTRLEEHKTLPSDMPFLSPYKVCAAVDIEKERRECIAGYAGNEVQAESVEAVYLTAAMIVGPIPAAPTIGARGSGEAGAGPGEVGRKRKGKNRK